MPARPREGEPGGRLPSRRWRFSSLLEGRTADDASPPAKALIKNHLAILPSLAARVLFQSGVVQLFVRLSAAPGREHELADALRSMKRQVHRQRGCSAVHVAAEIDDAGALWYCEEWQDRERLEDHMRTNQFARLLALLETTPNPPLLEFRFVSETWGLEYVATVRGIPVAEIR